LSGSYSRLEGPDSFSNIQGLVVSSFIRRVRLVRPKCNIGG
jgi:hypothetical protein